MSPDLPPLLGRSGHATMSVTAAATAASAGSGDLPVLATPRLVALMEEAACSAVTAALPPGMTTVGTRIDIHHRVPSPLGADIIATATVVAVDGSRVTFEVSAVQRRDEGDVEIGSGSHDRAVVHRERFMSRLEG